jgi:hypothetical protein
MITLLEKCKAAELKISADKGPFTLFAIVQREGTMTDWDILLSAFWFGQDPKEILDFAVTNLLRAFAQNELLALSRVIPLQMEDPILRHFTSIYVVEHGNIPLPPMHVAGLTLSRGLLLTSKLRDPITEIVEAKKAYIRTNHTEPRVLHLPILRAYDVMKLGRDKIGALAEDIARNGLGALKQIQGMEVVIEDEKGLWFE